MIAEAALCSAALISPCLANFNCSVTTSTDTRWSIITSQKTIGFEFGALRCHAQGVAQSGTTLDRRVMRFEIAALRWNP
jgi:hypothetical protein